MKLLRHLPRASGPALLGSFASLASQAIFAVFLLKLFEPAAVGTFSLVNQIAFSWATLALAQSPLSLLADRSDPSHNARRAWGASVLRMVWIAPLAAIAWLWSSPAAMSHGMALGWLAAIAFTQLTWAIAQSLMLRTGAAASIFLVRCVPPALAAIVAWLGAGLFPRSDPTALLAAALAGYVAGAMWLVPVLLDHTPAGVGQQQTDEAASHDDRSARLKIVHTLFDLVSSTLIAVQWTRVWGPVEAGYLLVLLRVYGFVPALVHTAWAQVLLSRGEARTRASLATGGACCVIVALIGLAVHVAIAVGGLAPQWSALRAYIWPLAIWQMAACMFAAMSHLPFIAGRARTYSLQSIGVDTMLLGLLLVAPLVTFAPSQWLMVIAACMTVALLAQAAYYRGLAR